MHVDGFTAAFVPLLCAERLVELAIARRNEGWIRGAGGVEHGARLTRWIVAFHAAWFAAFILEAGLRGAAPVLGVVPPLVCFGLLQALRYWCIASLGPFWNTKVLVLPGAPPVRRGPYRWLRHPNYLVVLVEIALYPALFGCWVTALVFGLVNAVLLQRRVAQEDAALRAGAPRGGHAPPPRRRSNTGYP